MIISQIDFCPAFRTAPAPSWQMRHNQGLVGAEIGRTLSHIVARARNVGGVWYQPFLCLYPLENKVALKNFKGK